MEFFENLLGFAILLLLAAAVIGAGVGIAWLWIRFRGWMFLVFFLNLAVLVSLPSDAPLNLHVATMVILFVMFWTGLFAGAVLIVGDVQNFGEKLTDKPQDNLHQHGESGWHDHPHDERSHAHHDNNLNGSFYYVDERVIDQRQRH